MTIQITNNYSISKTLREENKSNDAFEIQLNRLSLEELISLKLELGFKTIGFRLEGYPLWRSLITIIKVSILNYVVSCTHNDVEAARLLGITERKIYILLKKYRIKSYFKAKEKENADRREIKKDLS